MTETEFWMLAERMIAGLFTIVGTVGVSVGAYLSIKETGIKNAAIVVLLFVLVAIASYFVGGLVL